VPTPSFLDPAARLTRITGPGRVTPASVGLGITAVTYWDEPLAPQDRIITVFRFKGLEGGLLIDNPLGWIEGILGAALEVGWTEGCEYLRPARHQFEALVSMLHPNGWATESGGCRDGIPRLFVTTGGVFRLHLAAREERQRRRVERCGGPDDELA